MGKTKFFQELRDDQKPGAERIAHVGDSEATYPIRAGGQIEIAEAAVAIGMLVECTKELLNFLFFPQFYLDN